MSPRQDRKEVKNAEEHGSECILAHVYAKLGLNVPVQSHSFSFFCHFPVWLKPLELIPLPFKLLI